MSYYRRPSYSTKTERGTAGAGVRTLEVLWRNAYTKAQNAVLERLDATLIPERDIFVADCYEAHIAALDRFVYSQINVPTELDEVGMIDFFVSYLENKWSVAMTFVAPETQHWTAELEPIFDSPIKDTFTILR